MRKKIIQQNSNYSIFIYTGINNTDHAHGLAEFLELDPLETEYLIGLVLYSKSNSSSYRRYLPLRAERLKESRSQLAERVPKSKRMLRAMESFYFTSWYWCAIHMATACPNLQSTTEISEHFDIPKHKVESVLQKLFEYGLVTKNGNKWEYQTGAVHLPRESSLTEVHQSQWRDRAMIDLQKSGENSVHFTSVSSMSAKDYSKLKDLAQQLIANSKKIIHPSPSEDVYCINIDTFKV